MTPNSHLKTYLVTYMTRQRETWRVKALTSDIAQEVAMAMGECVNISESHIAAYIEVKEAEDAKT